MYTKTCSVGFADERGLEWLLRISVAMTFIGHGAYGFVFKAGWLPLYKVLGIGPEAAHYLFPMTGLEDVTMGLLALFLPIRAPFLFLAFWGIFTAILRPLAVDLAPKAQYSWYELWERAGNYIPAIVMVYLVGVSGKRGFIRGIFEKVSVPALDAKKINTAFFLLRLATCLLLMGHAGYGAVMQKTMLMKHYASIGLGAPWVEPLILVTGIGYFEFVLAFIVLVWPKNSILWFVVLWKVATELLYVPAGVPYDIFEWIERGGSYMAPLMMICLNQMKASAHSVEHKARSGGEALA